MESRLEQAQRKLQRPEVEAGVSVRRRRGAFPRGPNVVLGLVGHGETETRRVHTFGAHHGVDLAAVDPESRRQ